MLKTFTLTLNLVKKKWAVASLVMDFVRWDDTRNLCIVGDEGTLDWDLNQAKSYTQIKRTKLSNFKFKRRLGKSYFRMWRSFCKEFEKFCNFDDAWHVSK